MTLHPGKSQVPAMTDIGTTSGVFTNSAGGDLLQQAFQQVVDGEEHDEFVAFLESDGGDVAGESQVIQITAEQAAALGITFRVEDEQTPAEGTTDGFQPMEQQTLSQEESQRIINELTQSGLLKSNDGDQCNFGEWAVQQPKYVW